MEKSNQFKWNINNDWSHLDLLSFDLGLENLNYQVLGFR